MLEKILIAWVGLSSLAWVVMYVRTIIGAWGFPHLRDLESREPESWPRVSILIPACNEADTLEAAMETLLGVDYPNLEIVLINDRSTDETGEIVDRIAARDERVAPVHIDHLPEGWLGKVHALQTGYERVTGEWLLLTDADVHFEEGALRRAVATATHLELDHLTLVPELKANSYLMRIFIEMFGMALVLTANVDEVADPESDAFMGVGAFNLVRKSTFDETGGFAELRMEIADDFGVGMLIKEVDGRSRAAFGTDHLELEWYPSLGSMIRGLRKNAFAAMCRLSYLRAAVGVTALATVVVGPFVGFTMQSLGMWPASIGAILMLVLNAAVAANRWGRPFVALLFVPLGQLIMAWTIARSAYHYWRLDGVEWRGTRYSLEELREHQKVVV